MKLLCFLMTYERLSWPHSSLSLVHLDLPSPRHEPGSFVSSTEFPLAQPEGQSEIHLLVELTISI